MHRSEIQPQQSGNLATIDIVSNDDDATQYRTGAEGGRTPRRSKHDAPDSDRAASWKQSVRAHLTQRPARARS